MANIIIPPIGTEGMFTFSGAFSTSIPSTQKYKVNGVRLIKEMHDSQIDVYANIYLPNGLTSADYNNDLNNDIPIITLVSSGGSYYYVPASHIATMPSISGIPYRNMILSIALGPIPLDMDLTMLKSTIVNDVYTAFGITTTINEVPASAVTYVTDAADQTFRQLLASRATVTKSYKTLYLEQLALYNAQTQLVTNLETYIKAKGI